MEIADYTKHHNARGGLELLAHLELLGKLSFSEKKTFYRQWDSVYEGNGKHFLSAACELYSLLPFFPDLKNVDHKVRAQREAEFTKEFNSVEKEYWMRE
ncbi:hypothetical protein KY348_01035 [Candidatus Woesearchaeota archaeon]|nr:hypothetical protein [Candidatus Woesearchaeota archaeon]